MKSSTRAAVAYVGARLITGNPASGIHVVMGDDGFRSIDGTVSPANVDVYDYTEKCQFGGSPPSLYHSGNRQHVDLTVSGGGWFYGYDYDSKAHFEGKVTGNDVQLYDYRDREYFFFTL